MQIIFMLDYLEHSKKSPSVGIKSFSDLFQPKKLDLIIKPGQAKGSLAWLDLSQNISGLDWLGLTQAKPVGLLVMMADHSKEIDIKKSASVSLILYQ